LCGQPLTMMIILCCFHSLLRKSLKRILFELDP
jgi:hypothetical protein